MTSWVSVCCGARLPMWPEWDLYPTWYEHCDAERDTEEEA